MSDSAVLFEPLTIREPEVLLLLGEGASNAQIARRLMISEATVKKHLSNIFARLKVRSRAQASYRAQQLLRRREANS